MIPARYDFRLQPGTTFEGRVFLFLDSNNQPVNLAGCTPIAKVALNGNSPTILDLTPELVDPVALTNPVTVVPDSDILTSVAHGLTVGMNLVFASTGTLPYPLRTTEHYIVMAANFTVDTFSVMSFRSALFGANRPLKIQSAGTGTLTASLTNGQILIPEIAFGDTVALAEANAQWELMVQDTNGRKLAPFVKGSFVIAKGTTP